MYSEAIDTMKSAAIVKAPLQKLKMYLKAFEHIDMSIRDFYAKQGRQQCQIACDADNFLGIIEWVIIQAQAAHVYRDIKIIEAFV